MRSSHGQAPVARQWLASGLAGSEDGRGSRTVKLIETHFAWVLLCDRHAYKIKKPVSQGSMDYRTLAGRGRGCRAELRLNRRLAPDVYQAVVPVVQTRGGALALGRRGRVVEWLVKMRRLPASGMLDWRLSHGTVAAADLDRVMARLTSFFDTARPMPLADRAFVARLAARAKRTARELRRPEFRLGRQRIDRILRIQLDLIRRGVLAARGGQVIEGHGDLRPEHIYVGSAQRRACVIDCLEFDLDLRRVDPVEEMGFLMLECTRMGRPDVATQLLARYRRHGSDPVADSLVHLYASCSAMNRAQIAIWHLRDRTLSAPPSHWRGRARSYLADALAQAQLARREFRREHPAPRPSRHRHPPVARRPW
ncbi:MAG TPA: hypothetical protein VMB48_04955 [Steroidobacteraceae bacterium]|nr:hypothetical protein [Steroidobacteraceae bacterium]